MISAGHGWEMKEVEKIVYVFTHHLCLGLRRFKIFLHISGEITLSSIGVYMYNL